MPKVYDDLTEREYWMPPPKYPKSRRLERLPQTHACGSCGVETLRTQLEPREDEDAAWDARYPNHTCLCKACYTERKERK